MKKCLELFVTFVCVFVFTYSRLPNKFQFRFYINVLCTSIYLKCKSCSVTKAKLDEIRFVVIYFVFFVLFCKNLLNSFKKIKLFSSKTLVN